MAQDPGLPVIPVTKDGREGVQLVGSSGSQAEVDAHGGLHTSLYDTAGNPITSIGGGSSAGWLDYGSDLLGVNAPFTSVEAPTSLIGGIDANGDPEVLMFFHGSTASGYSIGVAQATALEGPYTVQNSGSPVLTPGAAGSWDDGGVALVDVMFDPYATFGTNMNWLMWYCGWSGAVTNGIRMGLAYSNSLTGPYTKHASNPILTPPSYGANKGGWAKGIAYHDGLFWTLFPDDYLNDFSPSFSLYTASNPYGPWTRYGVVISKNALNFEAYGILPGGFTHFGGRFHAFYTGSVKGGTGKTWSPVLHAWSPNGYDWYKDEVPLIDPDASVAAYRSEFQHPYPMIVDGRLHLLVRAMDRSVAGTPNQSIRLFTGPYEADFPRPERPAATGAKSGSQTVATAGTPVALSSTPVPCRSVTVRAKAGNTGNLYVGTSSPSFPLAANEAVSLDVADVADVSIDVDTGGEGADWLAEVG